MVPRFASEQLFFQTVTKCASLSDGPLLWLRAKFWSALVNGLPLRRFLSLMAR